MTVAELKELLEQYPDDATVGMEMGFYDHANGRDQSWLWSDKFELTYDVKKCHLDVTCTEIL